MAEVTITPNGNLGLPTEVLEEVLIDALGHYPIPRPFDMNNASVATPPLESTKAFHESWDAIRRNYAPMSLVCRLWYQIAAAHFFASFEMAHLRRTNRYNINPLELYESKRHFIQRATVSLHTLRYFGGFGYLRTWTTVIRSALDPSNIDNTFSGSANGPRSLRHLVISDILHESLWVAIVQTITMLDRLESLGIHGIPLKVKETSISEEGCLGPFLRILDIKGAHPQFTRTGPMPFYLSWKNTSDRSNITKFRIRTLAEDMAHEFLGDMLGVFAKSLTHLDLETEIITTRLSHPLPSLPNLIQLDISFPFSSFTLREFRDAASLKSLTINSMDKIWEWRRIWPEDFFNSRRLIHTAWILHETFQTVFDCFFGSAMKGPVVLENVILGDLYKDATSPLPDFGYWEEFKGIMDDWTGRFKGKGVTFTARKDHGTSSQPIGIYLERLISLEMEKQDNLDDLLSGRFLE